MPRFEPAPQDDHLGEEFAEFPELADALRDLAAPKDLRQDVDDVPGRVRPEDVPEDVDTETEDGPDPGD